VVLQPGVPFADDVCPQVPLFHFQAPQILLSLAMRPGWSRWSGGEDGSLRIRLPALSDETDTVRSAVGKRSGAGTDAAAQ